MAQGPPYEITRQTFERETIDMPKMKTHRGAAKRFKVTGSGKIVRRNSNLNHILEKKSASRKRRLSRDTVVTGGDRDHVRRQLGI
jgi:large subunit ribosomal protein L35